MIFVVVINLLAVLFTYLETKGQMKNGMKIGFILVTLVACLHYDFGSDYMDYYKLYKEVDSYNFTWATILDRDFFRDPGWLVLNWIFRWFGGFFGLVAVLNIIQNIAYYKFIRNYSSPERRTFSVFLYLFLTTFYMMNFSMMRQGLVIALFVAMWPLIEKRRWALSLLLIFLLSFIHKSVVLLYPFAFWGFVPVKNTKKYAIGGLVLLMALYISQNFLSDVFDRFMLIDDFENYSEKYTDNNTGHSRFGIGAFIQSFPFIIAFLKLIGDNDYTDTERRIILLSLIGYLIVPFTSIIHLLGRAGWYFSAYAIVATPILFSSIKNNAVRLTLTSLYVLLVVYNLFVYYASISWNMSTYHTIFEVL